MKWRLGVFPPEGRSTVKELVQLNSRGWLVNFKSFMSWAGLSWQREICHDGRTDPPEMSKH